MWWTAANTGLPDLPKVTQAFQSVHKVVPPSQQEMYIVDPNRNYNSALITLQGSFERAGPNPNPAAFTQANNDAISARGVAQQLIATFPPDTEAQLDKDVARLLLQPIEGVNSLQPDVGGGARSFCAAWGPLTAKFPFNPTAQAEVSLNELGDILRPQSGKLWQLYESQIKQVLQCQQGNCTETGAMPVNPKFTAFISNMMKFSRALYGDNAPDPNYKYSIRAVARPPFEGYDLKVNGEAAKLSNGQSKAAVWPGPSPQFSIALRVGNASLPTGHEYQGLWSVFRFFAYADRSSGSNFVWTNRSGQQGKAGTEYELQVDSGGNPVIFSKQFLSTLKCESKVPAK
jgi:type VI secretion system protein ImpL